MRLHALVASLAATVALAAASTPAHAAPLFASAGCGGLTFVSCAAWSASYSGSTLSLTVTNASADAPASNANSVFTRIYLGNVLRDYVLQANGFSVSGSNVGSWSYANEGNGFNLLVEDTFGANAAGNNGLTVGKTATFQFQFTQAITSADFASVQLAIHDQGAVAGCGQSSKSVFDGNTGALVGSGVSCAPGGGGVGSVVPEPSTYLLMGSGLLGLAGVARRRRSA